MALTDIDSWVLDPFSGVGSTVIGAIKNNRKGMGIEKEIEYCKIARQRIEDLKEGKLKIRPINKPIHKPTNKDNVAQFPKEWSELSFANGNGTNEQK